MLEQVLDLSEQALDLGLQLVAEVGELVAAAPLDVVDAGRELDPVAHGLACRAGGVEAVLRPDARDHDLAVTDALEQVVVEQHRRQGHDELLAGREGRDEVHRRRPEVAGNEHVGRSVVELARRPDLVDESLVHHGDAIGQ